MRKRFLCIMGVCLMLSGCSTGVSQEEYESVSALASSALSEKEALENEKEILEGEKESLEGEKESLSVEIAAISLEYSTYKESMEPYEGLSEAEANARKIEAESKADAESIAMEESKAAKRAADRASREAKEASIAAQEALGYETGITYDQLARTPNDFIGFKIKFKGKVIQVLEGDDIVQIRLAVNKNYDTILYCEYEKSLVSSRVLEDDIITIYGVSTGLLSYKSTMGGTITIPSATVDRIDQ